MRQKLFIFLGLIILIVVLVGLNAASYTQKEKMPDSEMNPNRSTLNGGATGTRAFYDLLAETGRRPVRWTQPPIALESEKKNAPATFVIIGGVRQEFTEAESEQLLRWVAQGNQLVIFDRDPPAGLLKTTTNWEISVRAFEKPFWDTDAYSQTQMTAGTKAAKPVLPSIFTRNVNAVQPSRFAGAISIKRLDFVPPTPETGKTPPTPANKNGAGSAAGKSKSGRDEASQTVALMAPVVHLANDRKDILVDVPYGLGQIVFVSDPYIVSNTGIGITDNAQLAVNIVASRGGIIAFDEYHQGYGANKNRLLEFFAGTPVIAIFLQIALLIGLLFYSQSRRFARAVPEPEPNRLSKLEYVSAMAELQQRTKGYDLAIENIYTDFRRRVSRLVGVDTFSTRRRDLALLIVERLPDEDADQIEALMQKCEDVMHGERTGKKEVLRLTTRLRELEEKLGLQRRKRSKK